MRAQVACASLTSSRAAQRVHARGGHVPNSESRRVCFNMTTEFTSLIRVRGLRRTGSDAHNNRVQGQATWPTQLRPLAKGPGLSGDGRLPPANSARVAFPQRNDPQKKKEKPRKITIEQSKNVTLFIASWHGYRRPGRPRWWARAPRNTT